MKKNFFCFFIFLLLLNPLKASVASKQVLLLAYKQKLPEALSLYMEKCRDDGVHDYEVIEEICHTLLHQGIQSGDKEQELLTLYGTSLAQFTQAIDIIESGIKSRNPETEIAAVRLLGAIEDDSALDLLQEKFSSPNFECRFEAAFQLAHKKSKRAVFLTNALMQKLPKPYWVFFPKLYALAEHYEATSILKKLVTDSYLHVRLASLLALAEQGRDDFLTHIRASASHAHPAEQETAATCLGMLKDGHAKEMLKRLVLSSCPEVQCAAASSLYQLGESSYKEVIKDLARKGHCFSIARLSLIDGCENLLAKLTKHPDATVRLNAALTLLQKKDVRALAPLEEILLPTGGDFGFVPQFSLGRSLMAWKVIPSAAAYGAQRKVPIYAMSYSLKEHVIAQSLELPEPHFLRFVKQFIIRQDLPLIPTITLLLENKRSTDSITMLKKMSEKIGSPLVRDYANLALFRTGTDGPYRKRVHAWIDRAKDEQLIQLKPTMPRRDDLNERLFKLSPEETSRLMVESLLAIANKRDSKSIDLLLEVLRDGHPNNRPVIAGLLIYTLQ